MARHEVSRQVRCVIIHDTQEMKGTTVAKLEVAIRRRISPSFNSFIVTILRTMNMDGSSELEISKKRTNILISKLYKYNQP